MSYSYGHVPVGTGQQTPVGTNPYHYQPNQPAVVVYSQGGQPAREVPARVRGIVESRTHYPHHHGRPVVVVSAQHQAERDYRQIPGTNSVAQTFRSTHHRF